MKLIKKNEEGVSIVDIQYGVALEESASTLTKGGSNGWTPEGNTVYRYI